MIQNQRPTNPSQQDVKQDEKQVKDSGDKMVGTSQNEWDPRSELGLKSPVEESENSTTRPGQQKAMQLEDNPNPPGKESRNDQ